MNQDPTAAEPADDSPPTTTRELDRLLGNLQKLMQQLRARIWQQRLQRVSLHPNHRKPDTDLGAVIERYIRVCAGINGNGAADRREAGDTSAPSTTPPADKTHHQPNPQATTGASGLSRYLHRNNHDPSLPSPLVDHFRTSVWDHIHAAIRLTKLDQIRKAKMHAKLANNALKEAANYMDENDFQQFMTELNTSLRRIDPAHGSDT